MQCRLATGQLCSSDSRKEAAERWLQDSLPAELELSEHTSESVEVEKNCSLEIAPDKTPEDQHEGGNGPQNWGSSGR